MKKTTLKTVPQKELLVKLNRATFIGGITLPVGTTTYVSIGMANLLISGGAAELVVNSNGYNTVSDDYGTVTTPVEEVFSR